MLKMNLSAQIVYNLANSRYVIEKGMMKKIAGPDKEPTLFGRLSHFMIEKTYGKEEADTLRNINPMVFRKMSDFEKENVLSSLPMVAIHKIQNLFPISEEREEEVVPEVYEEAEEESHLEETQQIFQNLLHTKVNLKKNASLKNLTLAQKRKVASVLVNQEEPYVPHNYRYYSRLKKLIDSVEEMLKVEKVPTDFLLDCVRKLSCYQQVEIEETVSYQIADVMEDLQIAYQKTLIKLYNASLAEMRRLNQILTFVLSQNSNDLKREEKLKQDIASLKQKMEIIDYELTSVKGRVWNKNMAIFEKKASKYLGIEDSYQKTK